MTHLLLNPEIEQGIQILNFKQVAKILRLGVPLTITIKKMVIDGLLSDDFIKFLGIQEKIEQITAIARNQVFSLHEDKNGPNQEDIQKKETLMTEVSSIISEHLSDEMLAEISDTLTKVSSLLEEIIPYIGEENAGIMAQERFGRTGSKVDTARIIDEITKPPREEI